MDGIVFASPDAEFVSPMPASVSALPLFLFSRFRVHISFLLFSRSTNLFMRFRLRVNSFLRFVSVFVVMFEEKNVVNVAA